MLAWMLYVAMVTLLLSGAAFAAERNARLRRVATRWIWLCAILASLLLPTAIASVSLQMPPMFSPNVPRQLVALRQVTSRQLSPAFWVADAHGAAPEWRSLDPLLKAGWMAVSALMLVLLLCSGLHLFWRKRRWQRQDLLGEDVYVTEGVGPAVVGLLRARIVVPAWVLAAPREQQMLVMAHERAHVDARDPQLLTVALCLLVAMPWNLPLWWQLRRLRRAIEVDCDARVLGKGHAMQAYGETLIEVGCRQSRFVGAVAAMSESTSFLEERIHIMTAAPSKWARSIAAGLAALSIGIAAVAAQVAPPDSAGNAVSAGSHKQVAVSPAVLAAYVGDYKLNNFIMSVTLDGEQLKTQLTGQPVVPIYPESDSSFFAKVVDSQISFERNAAGQAVSLTLHQHGRSITAPRIDPALARQIQAAIAEKIRTQQPSPGSEAATRRTLEAIIAGKPNLNEMSPGLAAATQKQLPAMQASFAKLGAIESVKFIGVGNQGWDSYVVRMQNGALQCRILMMDSGLIDAMFCSPGL